MFHSTPDPKVHFNDPTREKLAWQHAHFHGKIVAPMCSGQTSSGCKEQSAALSSYMTKHYTVIFQACVNAKQRQANASEH